MACGPKGHAISIHALLAESDANSQQEKNNGHEFLSTLSLRRATTRRASRQQPAGISIHALLAESDSSIEDFEPSTTHFYPRSPCGERPVQIVIVVMDALISIHALLAESDKWLRGRSLLD